MIYRSIVEITGKNSVKKIIFKDKESIYLVDIKKGTCSPIVDANCEGGFKNLDRVLDLDSKLSFVTVSTKEKQNYKGSEI